MNKFNFNLKVLTLVFGLGLALISSAFIAEPAKVDNQWFQYDGVGDIDDPDSYEKFGSTSPGCSGDDELCSIRAMEDENEQPVITQTLVNEINAALGSTPTSHPNVELYP